MSFLRVCLAAFIQSPDITSTCLVLVISTLSFNFRHRVLIVLPMPAHTAVAFAVKLSAFAASSRWYIKTILSCYIFAFYINDDDDDDDNNSKRLKNFDDRPHRRGYFVVKNYCDTRLLLLSVNRNAGRQHAQKSRSHPLKSVPSRGGSGLHLHSSLGSPESTSQTTSRSVQPFLHGSRSL